MFLSEKTCNSGSEIQRRSVVPSLAWDIVENLMPQRLFCGNSIVIMKEKEKHS